MRKLKADATPPLCKPIAKSILPVLVFYFCCSSLNAQLSTAFKATPTSGCAPLLVNFTDESTGGATGWRWDLGNGTISTQQNPSTTYLTPGIYTVKLVITNASGKDSLIKTNYINVIQPPQAAFSTSTSSVGCFPLLPFSSIHQGRIILVKLVGKGGRRSNYFLGMGFWRWNNQHSTKPLSCLL